MPLNGSTHLGKAHHNLFLLLFYTLSVCVYQKNEEKRNGKEPFLPAGAQFDYGRGFALSHSLSLCYTQTVMKSLCNRICRISAGNGAPAAPHPSIRTFRIFFISSSLSLSHSSTPPLVHCLCLSDEPLEAKTYISDKHTKFKQKCSSDVRTVNVKLVFC